MHDGSLPWLSLLALGALHGINPAMGWLFAVARGLQQRDRRAMWRAFGPLAIGHALAIVAAVSIALALGRILPLHWLRWGVTAALAGLGIDGLVRHRHVVLSGMQAGARELTLWSFLMASAHGAGLMVLPFVVGPAARHATIGMRHDDMPARVAGFAELEPWGITAPLIHTAGYLLVTAALAVVTYEWVGLRLLRRAWINVNAVWAAALIGAAALTLWR